MKRLLVAVLLLWLTVPASAREGFGFAKKAVQMERTIPPSTNAGARRVEVTVDNERGEDSDDAQTLSRYITDAILSGAGTVAEGSKAEVTILVSLDRLTSHESWNTETVYVRQQTGTKQKWNEKKQKMESEPVYSSVPVQKQYKVLTANLNGSYEISTKSDDVADGTIDRQFSEKYGDGETSPPPSEIEDRLLRQAATAVAANLVPTKDRVSVLLPRSTFEPLIPLAESGDWNRYLANVESTPPRKNAKDEAYRQYAIGVAKEALAYAEEDRDRAIELLRASASHFEVAIASNPGEELFRKGYTSLLASNDIGVPTARVSESLGRFEAWTSAVGASSPVRVASAGAPVAGPPQQQANPKQGMRNQTVIDLAKAGLADENIIMAIDAAPRTEFDVSPEGLIALSKGGVSRAVIAHMQKKSKR